MKNYYKNLHNFKRNVRKFQEGGAAPIPEGDVPDMPSEMEKTDSTASQDPMQALQEAMRKAIESDGEDCQAAFEVVNLLQEMMEKQQQQQGAQGQPAEKPLS